MSPTYHVEFQRRVGDRPTKIEAKDLVEASKQIKNRHSDHIGYRIMQVRE